jgi:hypothetical protein
MSDEDGTTETNDSEGIKNLRKQYEATQKELAETKKALNEFNAAKRQETVAGILKAKGVPPSAAKFFSGEDASEEAVGKWLEDHADVFQYTPSNAASDANTDAARRVTGQSFGHTQATARGDDSTGPIIDPEEALRLMASLPYEELEKLKLVAPRAQLWGAGKK